MFVTKGIYIIMFQYLVCIIWSKFVIVSDQFIYNLK